MNLGVITAITRKDLVDAIRNRYLLTALITPLFFALLFRVLLPGVNSRSLMTVVVHDSGQVSADNRVAQDTADRCRRRWFGGETAAEVEKRKAIGGLVVPLNFDADVTARQAAGAYHLR